MNMFKNKYKQITISEHISLYDKIIPKDHFLRKLKENVDFSFVNKLVEKEYCEALGRPAKEPEMMFKLLFLQTKDLLSDREVIKNELDENTDKKITNKVKHIEELLHSENKRNSINK